MHAHAAAPHSVKVQVNDDLVHFPDAKPFIDSNKRTQVPIRMVSEKMGYQVKWNMEGEQVEVTVKKDGKSIVLKTGEKQALVNGRSVTFDSSPVFADGRTYVPVRFISEAFGTLVQWDDDNFIAIIGEDGKYHAPAWYKPVAPLAPTMNPIVNYSKQFVGVPYVWGGTTPQGFDCSGFVKYLFSKQGVSMPRSSNEMYSSAGKFVSVLVPGDLVFFSDRKTPPTTHVGIYIGNNQFISATNSGVKVDTLFGSAYWGPKYIAAKRVM
jgi:peptidoglycan endopeptidase LytE